MVLDRDLVPQAAAIPMRAGRVCLISSRGGKRWVVPKGRLERGRGPEVIALQEAWEEAGLLGILLPKPLGTYRYEKDDLVHRVTVYQMDVVAEMDDWPEVSRRRRWWVCLDRSLEHVRDRGLRRIIRGVTERDDSPFLASAGAPRLAH